MAQIFRHHRCAVIAFGYVQEAKAEKSHRGVGASHLQLLFTYAPFMDSLLASAPIRPSDWGLVLLVGLASFGIVEAEKWMGRR